MRCIAKCSFCNEKKSKNKIIQKCILNILVVNYVGDDRNGSEYHRW